MESELEPEPEAAGIPFHIDPLTFRRQWSTEGLIIEFARLAGRTDLTSPEFLAEVKQQAAEGDLQRKRESERRSLRSIKNWREFRPRRRNWVKVINKRRLYDRPLSTMRQHDYVTWRPFLRPDPDRPRAKQTSNGHKCGKWRHAYSMRGLRESRRISSRHACD